MKQVSQIGRGQAMEGFQSDEYFKDDALFDGKPMEGMEDRSDVITGAGVSVKAGSRILNHLKSMEGTGGDASEERVTVIQTRGDEGMDEGFSSREGEAVSYFGYVAKMKVRSLDGGADMGIKREGGVQDEAKVASRGGGG